jgi:rhodanese-related sulfurtransferase
MKQTLITFAVVALAASTASAQPPAKPTIAQVCTTCHQAAAGELRGVFENVAFKSKSIQLKIDASTEVVGFDEATLQVQDGGAAKSAAAMRDIAKGKEARVVYTEKDGVKRATLVSFKGPIKIAPDKLIAYEEVARLVALGPDKGKYTLIDSRPLPRFQEGTIPTAINLPYPAFDKLVDRLPKDKSRLTIFFCQGVTCMMSPNSLRKAEALGYTNLRVYREGMPEWAQRNVGVVNAAALKDAWIDKQIPHVLIDVRPAVVARESFIAGAVSVPVSQVPSVLASLPDAKLKAPIFIYDGDGGTAAKLAASLVHGAKQINVNVLAGGIDAWKAAGYAVAAGTPSTAVAYAPKPRPGQISITEFVKLASNTPADVLILDVRNTDEANAGTIKGAVLIPDEEIATRYTELPKDKRIVAHCSTGVRAEMTYHKLKDKGFNVAFVKGDLTVERTGKFTIAAN